jgi:hypothetical protein
MSIEITGTFQRLVYNRKYDCSGLKTARGQRVVEIVQGVCTNCYLYEGME